MSLLWKGAGLGAVAGWRALARAADEERRARRFRYASGFVVLGGAIAGYVFRERIGAWLSSLGADDEVHEETQHAQYVPSRKKQRREARRAEAERRAEEPVAPRGVTAVKTNDADALKLPLGEALKS